MKTFLLVNTHKDGKNKLFVKDPAYFNLMDIMSMDEVKKAQCVLTWIDAEKRIFADKEDASEFLKTNKIKGMTIMGIKE